jgi:hypothetical protein
VAALDEVLDSDDSGLCAGLVDLLALLSGAGAFRWQLYLAGDLGLLAAPGGYGFQEAFSADTIDAALEELAAAGLVTFSDAALDDTGEPADDGYAEDADAPEDAAELAGAEDSVGAGYGARERAFDTVAADPRVARAVLARRAHDGTLEERGQRACTVLYEAAGSWPGGGYAALARGMTALTDHLTPSLGSGSQLAGDLLALRSRGMHALLGDDEGTELSMDFGERLVADHTRLLGPAHPASFQPRLDLGLAYLSRKRFEAAIGTLSRLLADQEAAPGDDGDWDMPLTRENLAITHLNAGFTGTGVRLLEQAVAEYERLLGAKAQPTLSARGLLGGVYAETGRVTEGIQLIEDAIAGLAAQSGEEDPEVAALRQALDEARSQAGGLGS